MDLGAIAAFVSAAEGGNFTVAATELGISASGVSKAVSRLENELHVRLFNRSTRSLSLTADGVALYRRYKQILIDLEDAKLAMSQAQNVPRGPLHVSIPVAFGRSRVIPAVSAFMRQYPLVKVDVSVTDRFVDVVEEGFDAVVRIGDLPDTRMIARSLGVTRFVVAASPLYLQQCPRPEKPEDLSHHNCVSFISPHTRKVAEWVFISNGQKDVYIPAGTLSLDDGEAMVDAAISHSGLIYCQDYIIEKEVKEGKLVRILDDFTTPQKPVVVMYPQNRHLSLKVRVFVDFMVAHFSRQDEKLL
jgi:LysR family transcriptional regulator for bpeEF and oprC